MAENYRIGPVYAFWGNFLDNSGSFTDVNFLGKTRGDAIVRPNVQIARGRVDQLGMAPLADAIHIGGYAPEITLPLVDEDIDKLKDIFPGSTKTTSGTKKALTFATTPQKIANASIGTLALIPVRGSYTDHGSGAIPWQDVDGYWFPAVIPTSVGEFSYGEITDTDDALNPHTVTFVAAKRTLWMDDSTSVAAATGVWFRGTPDQAGMTSGFDFVTNGITQFTTLIAT